MSILLVRKILVTIGKLGKQQNWLTEPEQVIHNCGLLFPDHKGTGVRMGWSDLLFFALSLSNRHGVASFGGALGWIWFKYFRRSGLHPIPDAACKSMPVYI